MAIITLSTLWCSFSVLLRFVRLHAHPLQLTCCSCVPSVGAQTLSRTGIYGSFLPKEPFSSASCSSPSCFWHPCQHLMSSDADAGDGPISGKGSAGAFPFQKQGPVMVPLQGYLVEKYYKYRNYHSNQTNPPLSLGLLLKLEMDSKGISCQKMSLSFKVLLMTWTMRLDITFFFDPMKLYLITCVFSIIHINVQTFS